MVVFTNARWLYERDSRHTFSLLESLSVLVNVFLAWVTTDWLGISNGEEVIKKQRFGNALVRRTLARASPVVLEESAKIKHERGQCLGRGCDSLSLTVLQGPLELTVGFGVCVRGGQALHALSTTTH